MAQPAVTRVDRASRVRVEGLADQLPNVRITDFEGRDVTPQLEAQKEGSAVSIVARAEPLLVRPRQIERVELESGKRVTLPGGMVLPIANAAGGVSDRAGWYRLTTEASPLPAPWSAEHGAYLTTLLFGLRRPPELPERLAPEHAVKIRLSYDGLAADEEPTITLDAAGVENEKSVTLRFRVLTESPRILVRSTFADADLVLRALPRLEVRPQQRDLLGFGLESIPISVSSVFAHGQPRPFEHETPLSIEVGGRARAEAVTAVLPTGATTTTFALRSAGLGRVNLAVTAGGFTGLASVEQRFPFGPLAAAVVGGALGGYARRFMKRARRNLAMRRAVEGVVVGLIAFVAGVLGVGYLRLPPAMIATEAGAFLVAALAGFVGVTLLERMSVPRATAGGRT